jgi:hypothetical protein
MTHYKGMATGRLLCSGQAGEGAAGRVEVDQDAAARTQWLLREARAAPQAAPCLSLAPRPASQGLSVPGRRHPLYTPSWRGHCTALHYSVMAGHSPAPRPVLSPGGAATHPGPGTEHNLHKRPLNHEKPEAPAGGPWRSPHVSHPDKLSRPRPACSNPRVRTSGPSIRRLVTIISNDTLIPDRG